MALDTSSFPDLKEEEQILQMLVVVEVVEDHRDCSKKAVGDSVVGMPQVSLQKCSGEEEVGVMVDMANERMESLKMAVVVVMSQVLEAHFPVGE